MALTGGLDTAALLSDPYRFIAKRCRQRHADLFETRLLFQKTICMSGPEAAELFYDESRFKRRDAAPLRLKKTLFGAGGVQTLDGAPHRHRKRMFMSLMLPQQVARLSVIVDQLWRERARQWAQRDRIRLYPEVQKLLMQAACAWAGVPLLPEEMGKRTRDIVALFDGAGAIGPRHWRARLARRRAERWLIEIVERTRAGSMNPAAGTALHTIAFHRDESGELLPSHTAAVELLNIVRPMVAISVYIVFIAHALHRYPRCTPQYQRALSENTGNEYANSFVQEVRRFYPFFPMVAARARRDFTWRGHKFARNERVMLDIYGTNHDRRSWYAPDEFRPQRFIGRAMSAYNFIPQGGGNHHLNHRCPGEWITIDLMRRAFHFLTTQIRYRVPPQNSSIDYARLPALPKSRFLMSDIQFLF